MPRRERFVPIHPQVFSSARVRQLVKGKSKSCESLNLSPPPLLFPVRVVAHTEVCLVSYPSEDKTPETREASCKCRVIVTPPPRDGPPPDPPLSLNPQVDQRAILPLL